MLHQSTTHKIDASPNSDNPFGLGALYEPHQTIFRLFTTRIRRAELVLYLPDGEKVIPMEDEGDGFFAVNVPGDWDDVPYQYIVDGIRSNDIYGKATTINSERSVVVNLRKTDPDGWEDAGYKERLTPWKEAIITEAHVRDFTIDPSSGVRHPGKFLGLAQTGTRYEGVATGLDHLKSLGTTHVHLLPVFDFLTVNEIPEYFSRPGNYNWGYDPENYNCIEGAYATDPYTPKTRIREFKEMIKALHDASIAVVMDVVYNHTFRTENSPFNIQQKDYFYRKYPDGTFSGGSGCGNELASEHPMVGQMILDSLMYYVREFHIDGFRFDLMALLDRDTCERIVRTLRAVYPEILIYGEPWMGASSVMAPESMTIIGTQRGKEFALFNASYRDALKGDNDGLYRGYVQGDYGYKNAVEIGVTGSIDFDEYHTGYTDEPWEAINYFNSHDNLILEDKLSLTTEAEKIDGQTLQLHAFLLLSFGLPFFHLGNEFRRSKGGLPNTYHSDDDINGVKWSDKQRHHVLYDRIRDLYHLRREKSGYFRKNAVEIRRDLGFIGEFPDSCVGYAIADGSRHLLVIHNIGEGFLLRKAILRRLFARRGHHSIETITEIYNRGRVYRKIDPREPESIEIEHGNTTVYEVETL